MIQVKIDFTAEHTLSIEALNILFARASANCPFLSSDATTSIDQKLIFAATQMAIYLQKQVGFDVSYTAYKSTINKNIYNVVYEYQNEDIGIAAIDYAVDFDFVKKGGAGWFTLDDGTNLQGMDKMKDHLEENFEELLALEQRVVNRLNNVEVEEIEVVEAEQINTIEDEY